MFIIPGKWLMHCHGLITLKYSGMFDVSTHIMLQLLGFMEEEEDGDELSWCEEGIDLHFFLRAAVRTTVYRHESPERKVMRS
mmetsp:Transcript_48338/g.58514  ORF Transcript_48338/g.58514 Transcript_48338/m.58514 type:complete len:82 (+) Transcript_48338:2084-2329(+)